MNQPKKISDLKTLQHHLLDMLKTFHAFCEKNGLEYALAGGSCLGAIRHKGFIPWDNDVDVVMPRDDYEKLLHNWGNSGIDSNLEIKSNYLDPAYPYPFIKISDKRTLVKEKHYKAYPIGIFIDVFPIDYISKDIKAQRILYSKAKRQQFILCGSFGRYEKRGTGFWDYTFGCIGTFLLHRCYKKVRKYYARKIDKTAQKYNKTCHEYAGSIVWSYAYDREVNPIEIFFPHSTGEFEGTSVNLPNNPDAYLKKLFGDYMQLPPMDQRFSHDIEVYYLENEI